LLEIFHSLQEAALSDGHHQVDGVKIFFAIEASGQVGVWVRGRMEVVTPWAAEAKVFAGMSNLQLEHGDDDLFNGDLVADHSQKIIRITVGHMTPQKISVAAMRT
jgi:hypothetical protein